MPQDDLLSVVAPEFNTNPARDTFLEIAGSLMNATMFGAQQGLAQAYLAAHMLKQVPDASGFEGQSAGPITSKREGDVAVTYRALIDKVKTLGDAELTETSYGRAYLRIRGSRAGGHSRVVNPQ